MADDLIQRLRMFARSPLALLSADARASVLGEAADALARKDAEIAALKLERDDYTNACKHSADDLMARDAEIAALKNECAELKEQRDEALRARERAYDNRDMALQSMEAAESQLAAPRERIEKAPSSLSKVKLVRDLLRIGGMSNKDCVAAAKELDGAIVALEE